MRLREFDFTFPQNLIAQQPLARRDDARLLVLNRTKGSVEHKVFKDILGYLKPADCLVLNSTQVIPARIFGKKITGGKVEMLVIREKQPDIWECLLKPGLKTGAKIYFDAGLNAEVIGADEKGLLTVFWNNKQKFTEFMDECGVMPLPPYIKRKVLTDRIVRNDLRYYQTVYAKYRGSIAAPTAGLHFTRALLNRFDAAGVSVVEIILHVGIGTFQKITADNVDDHRMEKEFFTITPSSAERINTARQMGGRVVAVGTTVVRTLESCAESSGIVKPGKGWTDIFIFPGHEFRGVDAMITNFHLPKASPFIMTSAFAGRDNLKRAYEAAIAKQYRFFSYGDAMLIL